MVVLEELEQAKARGARIYAELLGYGVSSDATHVSDPDPTVLEPRARDDHGLRRRGHRADRGGLHQRPRHVTPVGDTAETRVLKLALGEEHAQKTPVSSTKGATGHCLGAAGAVEAIFSILALDRGVLPPTINYEVPTRGATSTTSRTRRANSKSRSRSRTPSASGGTTRASFSGAGPTARRSPAGGRRGGDGRARRPRESRSGCSRTGRRRASSSVSRASTTRSPSTKTRSSRPGRSRRR